MKDPAFLFYYQDFLVGIEFMTNEEVGVYIRILCHMADKGSLSENQVLNICRGHAFTEVLRSKFLRNEQGNFYNKRLLEETEKRRKFTESRRNNRLSIKDVPNTSKSYDEHMENENENENINENKEERRYFESHYHQMLPPEFISTWRKYVDHQVEAGIKIHQHNVISHLKAFKECYTNGISPPELLEAFQQSSNKGLYYISKNLIEAKNGTHKQRTNEGKGSIDLDKYKRLAAKEPVV